MYFTVLLHVQLSASLREHQPTRCEMKTGLSPGWRVFCAVVQASLTTLTCITNMELKTPYKVPHGPTYIVVL